MLLRKLKYDFKGGEDSPEGLVAGGVPTSLCRDLCEEVDGGVFGREEELERFLCLVKSAEGALPTTSNPGSERILTASQS